VDWALAAGAEIQTDNNKVSRTAQDPKRKQQAEEIIPHPLRRGQLRKQPVRPAFDSFLLLSFSFFVKRFAPPFLFLASPIRLSSTVLAKGEKARMKSRLLGQDCACSRTASAAVELHRR
jgi:hypothetical protein